MAETRKIEDNKPLQLYELAYLVTPLISEDKLGEAVARLKGVFEKLGVFILYDEFPKFRQLAYSLQKSLGGKNERYSNAYFGWVRFETDASALAEIKAGFEKNVDIVRFLIVRVDYEPKAAARSPVWRREASRREAPEADAARVPGMSDAEIDKTIEELIVE